VAIVENRPSLKTAIRRFTDRGIWFIELAGVNPQSGEWYDAAILRDLLISQGEDVLPVQEQVEFIEKNWTAFCSLFDPKEIRTRLRGLPCCDKSGRGAVSLVFFARLHPPA
jgi:hypothetical protein